VVLDRLQRTTRLGARPNTIHTLAAAFTGLHKVLGLAPGVIRAAMLATVEALNACEAVTSFVGDLSNNGWLGITSTLQPCYMPVAKGRLERALRDAVAAGAVTEAEAKTWVPEDEVYDPTDRSLAGPTPLEVARNRDRQLTAIDNGCQQRRGTA
jgi:hypothetical protein